MQNYNLLEPVGQGQFGVRMAGQTFLRETLPQKTIADIADSVQSSGQEGWEALLHKNNPDEGKWGETCSIILRCLTCSHAQIAGPVNLHDSLPSG